MLLDGRLSVSTIALDETFVELLCCGDQFVRVHEERRPFELVSHAHEQEELVVAVYLQLAYVQRTQLRKEGLRAGQTVDCCW